MVIREKGNDGISGDVGCLFYLFLCFLVLVSGLRLYLGFLLQISPKGSVGR